MRVFLLLLLVIQGTMHLLGFAKAFHLIDNQQPSKEISKQNGVLWLVAAFLFLSTAILLISRAEIWWITGILAIILSQLLILKIWKEAKYRTIPNAVIIIVGILVWGSMNFEKKFTDEVQATQTLTKNDTEAPVTASDLRDLPAPVQKYLNLAGVVNKARVRNMRVVLEGQMRDKGADYYPIFSQQFNYFEEPTRLYFINAKLLGVIVPGYQQFKNGKARIRICPFGLFEMADLSGEFLDKSETVTLFNDMCLFAPATLIDQRIKWEPISDSTVKAIFTNHNIAISAKLTFNTKGELVNFSSDDRTAITDTKQHNFSTPVSDYKNINGFNLLSKGETVWAFPDGNFTSGKFAVKDIEYNVK